MNCIKRPIRPFPSVKVIGQVHHEGELLPTAQVITVNHDDEKSSKDSKTPSVAEVTSSSSSSSSSTPSLSRGKLSPPHSQSQHSRLRSSIVHVLLRPAAAVSVWLFRTLGTRPLSEGETADVATAGESAWWREFWMLWKRARCSGRDGEARLGFRAVEEGVGGL